MNRFIRQITVEVVFLTKEKRIKISSLGMMINYNQK